MKPTLLFLVAASLATFNVMAQNAPIPPTFTTTNTPTDFSKIFKSDKEKISYAIGMNVGEGLKRQLNSQDVEFDASSLVSAISSVMNSNKLLITEAQQREILNDFTKTMRAKMDEKRKKQAEEQRAKGEKNLEEGNAFLERNKTAPGVHVTPSGLQYKIDSEGSGTPPKDSDEVSVNYRGTLIDGTEFDSSAKRNAPLKAKVKGGIIAGWTEALEMMKPGAKWTIYVPAKLAYGERAMGPQIGPNSTLIFDMELVSVTPAAAAPAPSPTLPGTAGPGAMPPAPVPHSAPLTSDIIKVPSQEEMKKGAKIETIKQSDLDKAAQTNQ